MRKLMMLAAPAVAGWAWKKYRSNGTTRSGMPAEVTSPDLSQPQQQVEALERQVDVPGGIRP